jgi:hypothetical protein
MYALKKVQKSLHEKQLNARLNIALNIVQI